MGLMQVLILTTCRSLDLLYGSTLVFKMLRVGFPDATVIVVDNASIDVGREYIKNLSDQHECVFVPLQTRLEHFSFLDWFVGRSSGTVVFLDPDATFWGSYEDWDFSDYLFAGMLIPAFYDPYTETYTEARIHPSFFWIPDVGKLRDEIAKVKVEQFKPFFNAFGKLMFKDMVTDNWRLFDTATGLYSVFKDRAYTFREKELDSYDHLFQGSMFSAVIKRLKGKDRIDFIRTHDLAKNDYKQLKGVWR